MTHQLSSMTCRQDLCVARTESATHSPGGLQRNSRPLSGGQTLCRPRRLVRTPPKGCEWEAVQELLLASRERYVRVAFGILRNKEDAEDAVQDAFLMAYRHYRTFEGRSALTTWLARIVINAALMLRRKRINSPIDVLHEFSPDAPPWSEMIPAPQPDPEIAYANDETHQILKNLLGRMTPVLRQAITLRYCEQLPIKEASSLIGIPLGTYKARLFRAKQHLMSQAQIPLLAPLRRPGRSQFSFDRRKHQSMAGLAAETPSHEMVPS